MPAQKSAGRDYYSCMAKQEKLVQILYDGHASIQAETEPRQQSWVFQAPFLQLLVVEIFRQLRWMPELALSGEGWQPLQNPGSRASARRSSTRGSRYGSWCHMSQSNTRSLGQTGKLWLSGGCLLLQWCGGYLLALVSLHSFSDSCSCSFWLLVYLLQVVPSSYDLFALPLLWAQAGLNPWLSFPSCFSIVFTFALSGET